MTAAALRVWGETARRYIGNPSSQHRAGTRAEAALTDARARIAAALRCDPLDLVWTSGATEANNMVFHHIRARASSNAEVWVSAIEHPSVLAAARRHFPERARLIPVSRSGVVQTDWIAARIEKSPPALVAVLAANNETGVLQPWEQILRICRKGGVPFFTDAVQWVGKLPAAGLGEADFVSGSAHKFGGAKGAGFLKVPGRGRFEPLIEGGPQEDGRRAGTENVPGVCAMAAALDERERSLMENQHQVHLDFRHKFTGGLLESLPGAELIGASEPALWNTVCALMPETDCPARWVVKLDKLGFAVSTGSACSSGKEKPSHVLEAMGYQPEQAGRVLRFSGGWETGWADWEALLEALQQVRRQLS